MTEKNYQIDATLIDNRESLEARVAAVAESDQEALRLVLSYLYLADGPVSIARGIKSQAEPFLSPVELFVFQWLYKRTDGKLRRLYGPATLEAIKKSRYVCETCSFSDVRALHLEKSHFDKETKKQFFQCLCANCNTIRAREKEKRNNVAPKERTVVSEPAETAPAEPSS